QPSGSELPDRRGNSIEGELYLATEEVVQHRGTASIGHMDRAHASHQLEQLACHMGSSPASGRPHIELVWIGLGVGDEFEAGGDWNRGMHLHDQNVAADRSDWCDVAEKNERKIVEEGRVDRATQRNHDERIAVRR